MKLKNFLKELIVEASRMEVLIDKYAKKTSKNKKPLLELSKLVQIIFADPTTKKPQDLDVTDLSTENLLQVQPGAYTNWMIKHYLTPSLGEDATNFEPGTPQYQREVTRARDLFMEDLFKLTDDLGKFTKYKQYFPQDKRDINKFTPASLFSFLETFELPENVKKKREKTELKKEIRKEREGFKHPGASLEMVGDNYTVVKISDVGEKGQEAASWYGGFYDYDNGESRWCTSPPNSSYFKGYAKDGPLYVILANNDDGKVGKRTGLPQERYQFHFPSNQFMDRADRQINLVEFLNQKAPDLKEYFKPEFAKGLTTGGGQKVDIEYPSGSISKFIALYGFEEFFENLPDNIISLYFDNKSNENIALDVPPSIARFKNLDGLFLKNCLKSLPNEISQLENLSFLAIPNNPNLKTIPDSIVDMENLLFINMRGSKPKLSERFLETFSQDQGEGEAGFYTR